MKLAGIILCGGASRRMGTPKGNLPFGSETLLQRVVRIVGSATSPIVVVAAAGQELPRLQFPSVAGDDSTERPLVVRDSQPDCGPLEGLRTGLAALTGQADAVFVAGCDTPLITPAFIRRMVDLLGDAKIAAVASGGFRHPLGAVYRPSVLPDIERLLAAGERRAMSLLDDVTARAMTRMVDSSELADFDPDLHSLFNVNTPEAYGEALRAAGLPLADFPCIQ